MNGPRPDAFYPEREVVVFDFSAPRGPDLIDPGGPLGCDATSTAGDAPGPVHRRGRFKRNAHRQAGRKVLPR